MFKQFFNYLLISIILILLVFFSGKLFLDSVTKLTISDFHVYYYVPKMVFSEVAPMHPYISYAPIYPYFFPPASLPLMSFFSYFSFADSKFIWTILNFVFLFTSIYLILKCFGKLNLFFYSILSLLAVLFYPIQFTIRDGQFNIFLLFVFSLGFYYFKFSKNFWLISTLISIGIITKISPGILLFYALFKKNFKLILTSLFGVLIFVILSEIFVGYKINYYYFKEVVSQVSVQSSGIGYREQSHLALLKRINSDYSFNLSKKYLNIISYSLVLIIILFFTFLELRNQKSDLNNTLNISLLIFISVTGTGLTWFHQYSILFLSIVLMLFVSIFYVKKFRYYFLFSYFLVFLLWSIDFSFINFQNSYLEYYMYWGGWIFLINTFYLKVNQKYLSFSKIQWIEELEKMKINKFLILLIIVTLFYSIDILNFTENLKVARDRTRIEDINFIGKTLSKYKVTFKQGFSSSYEGLTRSDRGYILLKEKNEFSKIRNIMNILYIDPVNNFDFNYKFSATDEKSFELSSKLESNKYKSIYGDYYYFKSQ